MTHDPFTCTRRQDAELRIHTDELRRQDAELVRHCTSFEDLFGIVTRLATDLHTLRERVAALEADDQPDVRFVILEPVRDDAEVEGETPLGIAWDRSTFRFTPYFDEDSDDDPDPMEDV